MHKTSYRTACEDLITNRFGFGYYVDSKEPRAEEYAREYSSRLDSAYKNAERAGLTVKMILACCTVGANYDPREYYVNDLIKKAEAIANSY